MSETERKFILSESPPFELDTCECEAIGQGYVAIDPDGTEVRLRVKGGRRLLGIKSSPARTRVEEEIELDEAQFDSLWPLTEGRRIEKRRYVIPADDGLRIELDVYDGDLKGLLTAEIEFESEDQAERFEAPEWIGHEVTGDARYSNQKLATDGAPAHL
jgi:adenylate cyclase